MRNALIMFNEAEIDYLKSQPVVRIATATTKGTPNVATVGFEFDGEYFYVGSVEQEILHKSPRYRNVKSGNKRVALTIDDVVSLDPWKVRGIRINGVADIVVRMGELGEGDYIRVKPDVSWSWGLTK